MSVGVSEVVVKGYQAPELEPKLQKSGSSHTLSAFSEPVPVLSLSFKDSGLRASWSLRFTVGVGHGSVMFCLGHVVLQSSGLRLTDADRC